MMRLFINSLAASAGGGLTYIRNVLPRLAAKPGLQVTAAINPTLREEFRAFPNVECLEVNVPPARRFWYEQLALPGLIRRCRAEALLSAGNFALRNSPVPQILLSRNSIYTSVDFYRDLRSRHEYQAWLDTRFRAVLAKRSIRWADVTVAPSIAFAEELSRWTGRRVLAVHHGFDHKTFTCDASPLTAEVEGKLRAADGCIKLLFVSHYNYYRNFETLIRALPRLRERMAGRAFKLLLTCRLMPEQNLGSYRPEGAAELVKKLGVSDLVVELGTIPYRQLHRIYAQADVYVTPAYTETFAHPLVEAMASGVPVVASDLAVHREICRDAAAYFPRFSSEKLADAVCEVALSADSTRHMAEIGLKRSRDFSWNTHVEKVLELCGRLVTGGSSATWASATEERATTSRSA